MILDIAVEIELNEDDANHVNVAALVKQLKAAAQQYRFVHNARVIAQLGVVAEDKAQVKAVKLGE